MAQRAKAYLDAWQHLDEARRADIEPNRTVRFAAHPATRTTRTINKTEQASQAKLWKGIKEDFMRCKTTMSPGEPPGIQVKSQSECQDLAQEQTRLRTRGPKSPECGRHAADGKCPARGKLPIAQALPFLNPLFSFLLPSLCTPWTLNIN